MTGAGTSERNTYTLERTGRQARVFIRHEVSTDRHLDGSEKIAADWRLVWTDEYEGAFGAALAEDTLSLELVSRTPPTAGTAAPAMRWVCRTKPVHPQQPSSEPSPDQPIATGQAGCTAYTGRWSLGSAGEVEALRCSNELSTDLRGQDQLAFGDSPLEWITEWNPCGLQASAYRMLAQ
jgi:hypothetical protein